MSTRLTILACLVLAAPPAWADAAGDAAVAECDRMAADPADPDRPSGVKGVDYVADDKSLRAAFVCLSAATTPVPAGPTARRIQFQLGRISLASGGYRDAKAWFDKAAASGSTAAMISLSTMYEKGLGVARSDATAKVWLDKAIDAGSTQALAERAAAYDLAADYAAARVWYEKAAAKGNASAMRSLGTYYAEGRGVPQDLAVSRSWYEKAAAAGNGFAMVLLGHMYEHGNGVRQDIVAARKWYEKAVTAGDETAELFLKGLPR